MIRGALINGCRRSSIKKIISSARETHSTAANPYSPFEFKIQKILSTEIQYQCDYAPPHQPVTEYGSFMVDDSPGEQWVTLRRAKPGEDEEIRIEATMFDGFIVDARENVQLHINMSIDIRKRGGGKTTGTNDAMKFVCSAWPNSLEIHKVFICNNSSSSSSSRHDESAARLYMGPHFTHLNAKLRDGFYEFLNTRGINGGLSTFLHRYMMNKDRIELIQWLRKVDCFLKN